MVNLSREKVSDNQRDRAFTTREQSHTNYSNDSGVGRKIDNIQGNSFPVMYTVRYQETP